MDAFRAFRVHEADGGVEARFEDIRLDDLAEGDVVIRGHYSSINYKDALAATGAGKIMRRFPLVGGIDVAGEVVISEDARFQAGDLVLVTGCGLGEDHDGGYAEYTRVKGDWVIPIPDGLDPASVMRLGTAGFTAALAIHRLEHNGLSPEKGPVIVTGATGGVGSLAVDMLAGRGYEVTALTGKREAEDFLRTIGASEILVRGEFEMGRRPLERALWAGAVDNLGGETLAWITRTLDFWGSVACIGLAESHKLETTVMPFILRGANLLGVNSVATPRTLRLVVWDRLATELKPRHLETIGSRSIPFEALPGAFDDFLAGKVRGRTLVDLRA
jgi:acrylyl-CoA reductase (NADPH)